MKEEFAMVRDADGNEMYFGKTPGECQTWCKAHGITGENGEYIATGTLDERNYFEAEDYEEINPFFADAIKEVVEESEMTVNEARKIYTKRNRS